MQFDLRQTGSATVSRWKNGSICVWNLKKKTKSSASASELFDATKKI